MSSIASGRPPGYLALSVLVCLNTFFAGPKTTPTTVHRPRPRRIGRSLEVRWLGDLRLIFLDTVARWPRHWLIEEKVARAATGATVLMQADLIIFAEKGKGDVAPASS